MAGKQPDWAPCAHDGCHGRQLPNTAWCLAHAAEEAPDAFEAELKRISEDGNVDARGVPINAELLGRILAAVPHKDDWPVVAAARFDHATFQDVARFGGVTFKGVAGFDGVTFKAVARFDGAAFKGEARFSGAMFKERAYFGDVIFGDEARFDKTSFENSVAFSYATFHSSASFGSATFKAVALFGWATFQAMAWFGWATFQAAARFVGASFQAAARFDRASFQRAGQVGPMLATQLKLDQATFAARVQLDATAATVCARRAQFPAGVHLRLRYASVVLDDANFAHPAILAGVSTPFPELAIQEQHAARRWERLPPGPRTQRWRPRLLSLCRADVAGLRLADVDLRACRFAGAHNLDRLRIEGAPMFARTTRWWRAKRKTLAEEQYWRAQRTGRWRSAGWYPRACQPPASPKAELPSRLEEARLAALYRELRKSREDAKDEPGAADFYYGECEMRRHDPGTPRAERLVLWAYWLLSGYALRAWRALAALALVIGLDGIGFSRIGFHHPHPSQAVTWLYALQATVSLEGKARQLSGQLTLPGELLRVGLRFTGPVLLGLAVLSVRGRVRR
ncbi:MAG TPA: pentapeptide repeat-containing protein [Actinomycetes bacterium]